MRYYFLLFALYLTCTATLRAQTDHVANGGFETYTTCPTTAGQINNAAPWLVYSTSPDFFNTCSTNPALRPPASVFGYQPTASGNGYAGFAWYRSNAGYVEYIGAPIIPLQVGMTYEVSMDVSLANNYYQNGNDGLSVLFYNKGYGTISPSRMMANAQVEYSSYGLITDTLNWVHVTKTFVADSAYDNLIIGTFKPESNIIYASTAQPSGIVYYYIDNVSVKLYDSLTMGAHPNVFCAGDTFTLNYISTKKKRPGNKFTIQLSNASGSFTAPVNIGSVTYDTSGSILCTIPPATTFGTGYRLRILASDFADTGAFDAIDIRIENNIPAKPDANNNGPLCLSETLQLTATIATPGVSWSWRGPNTYTSSLQNNTISNVNASHAGDYIVTAAIGACKSLDTTTVNILSGSAVGNVLATANTPVCESDTLKLEVNTAQTGITFSWTGPAGFSSTLQKPTVPGMIATNAGDYIVTVSKGVCSAKDTITIVVKPLPQNFNATSNTPCEGQPLNFTTTTSSSGVIYAWAGPNSYSSSVQNPVIGSASAIHNGNYIVTGTLNGCNIKDTVTVTVKPTPAKPDANNNGPICEGAQLNLTSTTTTSGVTYGWTGPASYTSATQNNTINNSTTALSGDYIVTVNLNGCEAKDTTTVLVKPLPIATTLTSNAPICAGSSLQLFSTASSPGTSYTWNGPNSYTAITQNANLPNATTTASGWYRQTLSLNGCSRKDSVLVAVNAIPAAPTAGYTGPVCATEQLKLTATNVPGATYQWIGPNGYTSNIQNATRNNITTADAGNYIVRATVNGCTSTDAAVSVAVNPTPFVAITTPTDSICQGVPTAFNAFANNTGGTPQYKWYVNSQLAGTGTSFTSSTLNDKDVVRCDMADNAKCSVPFVDASNDIQMTVLPWLASSVTIAATPSTTVKENEYITFTATPTNGGSKPTYQWKRNGQNVQGATSNVWSANSLSDNDVITAELISNYRCPQPATATSNDIKVKVIPTGINYVNPADGLVLYPNPNAGTFSIKGKVDVNGAVTAQVINAVGQVVYTTAWEIQNSNIDKEITIGNIVAGVYVLKVTTTEGHTAIIKFKKI